jgi:hypothetical protein
MRAGAHIELDQHPDVAELQERLTKVLEDGHAGRLVEAHFEDRSMHASRRRFVAIYLSVLGLGLLAILPWLWSSANQAIAAESPVLVHFAGLGFNLSADAALALTTTAMGMIGSVVVLLLTFTNRAVHETLERGALWWYLTRPITGAMLGLLFYLAVIAGFFNAATASDRPALIVAAAVGALAGLFTDQVIKKMQGILGLLPFNRSSTSKARSNGDT